MGTGNYKKPTSVEESQASHQALNFEATSLWGLGVKHLGGLLGTEGHDKNIEHVTSECAAFKENWNDWKVAALGAAATLFAALLPVALIAIQRYAAGRPEVQEKLRESKENWNDFGCRTTPLHSRRRGRSRP